MESGKIATEIMKYMFKSLEFCITEFEELRKTKNRNNANELINEMYIKSETSYCIGLNLLFDDIQVRQIFQECFKSISKKINEMYNEIVTWD